MNEQDKEFLLSLKERLLTDNNRFTSDPIFLVREKYKETTMDDCGDYYEFIEDVTGDCGTYDTFDEMYQDLLDMGYELPDESEFEKFRRHSYNEGWRIINSHFTEAGAQAFINRKQHDYNELHIYVDSLCFCHEMKTLRDIILRMKI